MNYINMTKQDMEVERKLLSAYRTTVKKLPPGRLGIKRVRGTLHYYSIDEKNRKQTYIKKENLQLIHQLKQKRWMMKAIQIMEKNLAIQEKLLKHYRNYDSKSLQRLLPMSDSDALLEEYESKFIPDIYRWEKENYRKNPYKPEELKHTTSFGLKVRSKSEMIIAELLYSAKIPFHYDAAVRVYDSHYNQIVRYVDFLIKSPQGNDIIWEHMGLFIKQDYRESAFKKISEYFFSGIFMPNNLIITMDGPQGELDIMAIDRIIKGQLSPLFQE